MELPRREAATDEEVRHLIARERLYGAGIGYIDAPLIAAARLRPGTLIWTRDKRLRNAAQHLNRSADES